jgi:hypothetical protein
LSCQVVEEEETDLLGNSPSQLVAELDILVEAGVEEIVEILYRFGQRLLRLLECRGWWCRSRFRCGRRSLSEAGDIFGKLR